MIPYIAVAILSTFSSAAGDLTRTISARSNQVKSQYERVGTRWTPFDVLAVFGLVVFSGMRRGVGTDFGLYTAIYSRQEGLTWAEAVRESPQEIGFTTLSLLLHSLSNSPDILFWATSALTVIPFYAAIKAMSPHPAFSTLLYILLGYYLVPLNIVRQGIAMALNFYSLRFLRSSPSKFFWLNILATSFHVSVLPAFVIQWFLRNRLPSKRLVLTTCVITVILLTSLGTLQWMQSLAGYLNPRYETYLTASPAPDAAVGIGTYVLIAARVGLIFYSLALRVPPNMKYMQVLLIVSVLFQACAIVSPPIGRLEYYFSAIAVVLLPAQIAISKNRGLHTALFGTAACIYFVMYLNSFGGLLPYRI